MKKIKAFISVVLQTCLITAIVLVAVVPFSCKVSAEGIEIIGGDYSAPALNNINVVDEKTIVVDFSEPVKLSSIVVSPVLRGYSDSSVHSLTETLSPAIAAATGEYGKIECCVNYSEDGKVATVCLESPTEIGKSYELFGIVTDEIGNTLTFCIPFIGFNSKVPRIIMTEIQVKYGKGSVGGETVYRGEYVELLALEEGNLAGVELFSAADGENKKYSFPAIDVRKNELLLVHLRTVAEGCINEDDDDLNLATAPHSKDGIRDLWSTSTVAHFNDSSDVVVLRNTVDNSILDAVMYAAEGTDEWKANVADIAVEVCTAGVYSSSDVSCASSSKGVTTLKSLTRTNAEEIINIINSEEEYEYPFVNDEDTWEVRPVSPGVL